MTKCSVFINETMGNIKRQLKEAIKSQNLIGLLPTKPFPSCLFFSSNGRKKVLNLCIKYVVLERKFSSEIIAASPMLKLNVGVLGI